MQKFISCHPPLLRSRITIRRITSSSNNNSRIQRMHQMRPTVITVVVNTIALVVVVAEVVAAAAAAAVITLIEKIIVIKAAVTDRVHTTVVVVAAVGVAVLVVHHIIILRTHPRPLHITISTTHRRLLIIHNSICPPITSLHTIIITITVEAALVGPVEVPEEDITSSNNNSKLHQYNRPSLI